MENEKAGSSSFLLWVVVVIACFLGLSIIAGRPFVPFSTAAKVSPKPSPEQILETLKAGNESFVAGTSSRRNVGAARLALAGRENQEKHAYATVLSCSDSRVPVEIIFDAGIMELFVIRTAGNVADTHEIGSIEYGLGHVHTPLLLVLGHTQCGAVTAVSQAAQGHQHRLERNIPPLVEHIQPAVKRGTEAHPEIHGDALIPYAIEENVWQSVEDIFMKSPATRALVKAGKVKVAGAVYDVGTGKIDWLKSEKVDEILARVEASPEKETEPYAAH